MFFNIADFVARNVTDAGLARMYSRTPLRLVQGLARHRFRRTVRWAASHSPFYREAFRKHKIEVARVRSPEDLGEFFTCPDDLIADPEKFICRPPTIVFESSGTSGKNKQIYFDSTELDYLGKVMASGLRLMGVRQDDRVANAFDFSIWIPGMVFHEGLRHAGIFSQALGKVDPVEVYRRLEQHRFTVVLGEPTWLIRLTELAERGGAPPLRLLIGGAEEMPADAIPWMQRVWNGASIKMCYGSVELGSGLGFQPCPNHDGYHVDDVNFLPEIVDPAPDGYGEIVFTTLMRRVMPLIRYRTRDVANLLDERCPCGITAPRLSKLRGRRDEMVVASGGNLYPLMFERILKDIPGLTHDWQVLFTLDGVRETLEMRVESQRGDVEVLQNQVYARAGDLYPDFIKNFALGIFRMCVTVHAPGTLRSGRKLRRLVDLRHAQPSEASPDLLEVG